VIQLLIIAIAGGLWAAMWSFSGRIWPVKHGPDQTESGLAFAGGPSRKGADELHGRRTPMEGEQT